MQSKKILAKYYFQQKNVISLEQDLEPACRINVYLYHAQNI
jgi:hypothetical protein